MTAHSDRGRSGCVAWLAIAVTAFAGGPAAAQAPTPDFVKPRIVLNGQGHTAPLRALVFSPDGKYLLSGGLDKVVHVWEFRAGRPRLVRTIRPSINRTGGWIYALALAPVAGPDGQRLLAVAGHGVTTQPGDILIYRVPGHDPPATGDLAYRLPSDSRAKPVGQSQGHGDVVLGLAFSPDGRYLASCGKDKTIRIWDLGAGNHPTVAVLTGHTGEVARVVFDSNERLISGGGDGDGTLRTWSWKLAQPLANLVNPPGQDLKLPLGLRINGLARSPDGRHVAVGRENGKLERYDSADLNHGIYLNPGEMDPRNPVQAIAYSADGQFLATSLLKYPGTPRELPRTECEIALRGMPDGRPARVIMTARDLVRALAFSPDGRFLAIGGGDAQAIVVHDLQAGPDQPVVELKGPGTVLWNVAFVDDKPTLAYARQRPLPPAEWTWDGFDLGERRFVPVNNPERLARAITAYPGWSIQPGPAQPLFRLNAVSDQGQRVVIQLDPNEDLRWTSFTFLPPNPAARHPSLAVAVGCLGGSIMIHRLPDGQRTRVFLGHAGAIYGLAPSADGRWLASASPDQTVRLWALAGCDTPPALGLTLNRDPGGVFTVKEVAPRSFAQQMGLRPGDRIDHCSVGPEPVAPEVLTERLDAIVPGTVIAITVRRGDDLEPLQTTRRDSPVLSLFAGDDREWVAWMPEGYYDTSIAGDRRHLGWHVNKGVGVPTEFYPMSRYEAQLRQPRIIDTLLRTADAVGAIGAGPPPVVVAPPTIRIVAPVGAAAGAEIAARQPNLDLRIAVAGSPDRLVHSIVIRNGPVRYPIRVFDPAVPTAEVTQAINLQADDNPISIVATDNQGVEALRGLTVKLTRPRPAISAGPRLVVRSIGIEKFRGQDVPEIPFASLDARRLADFLVAPADRRRFRVERTDSQIVDGTGATSAEIFQVFERLSSEIKARQLRAGDTVFLVIESHVLNLGSRGSLILGADAGVGKMTAATAVPAQAISERLEEVAAEGCLVVMLLDGIHGPLPDQSRGPVITEWVRDLTKRGVIVLVASKQGRSERLIQSGAFAQAILDSVTVAGRSAKVGSPGAGISPTLDDFQAAVVNRVRELTGRRQFADFFPPEYLNWSDIRIFEPQAAPSDEVAGR